MMHPRILRIAIRKCWTDSDVVASNLNRPAIGRNSHTSNEWSVRIVVNNAERKTSSGSEQYPDG